MQRESGQKIKGLVEVQLFKLSINFKPWLCSITDKSFGKFPEWKVEFKPIIKMGNNDAIIITCSMLSCNGTTACLGTLNFNPLWKLLGKTIKSFLWLPL